MSLQSFFDNFAQLAETPNGIPKLRELILQLAVKGKLVAQDLQDEPASLLLERTRNADIKTGRHRDRLQTSIRSVGEAEIPFTLPPNWAWTTLAHVGHDWGQKRPNIDFTYIDVAAIDNQRGVITNTVKRLKPNEAPSRARKIVKRGSVIYSTVRPYLLNIAVVEKDYSPEPIASTAFAIIHPFEGISAAYLFYYLRSRTFIQIVERKMQGVAYPAINDERLFSSLVPLPPTREQERIVSKVYELLHMCDEFQARQQEKRESRVQLHNAALTSFDRPASLTLQEFNQATSRLAEHFDTFYDSVETVSRLRSTILQLAMQGKLVPQDSREEPVSTFLREIKDNNLQVSAKGRSRPGDIVVRENPDGELYDLPRGWKWSQIRELFDVVGGIQKTPERRPRSNYYPYLRVGNVYRGQLDLTRIEYFELSEGELERWRLKAGDLLIVEGNGSENEIGRCAVWNGEIENCVHQNHLIRCRPIGHHSYDFVLRFLNSPLGIAEMKRLAITTSGLYSLSVGKIRGIDIPIPPLAEQERIVAKVDQLMALCDDLEAKLRQAETDGEKLMDAAVKHVLDVVPGKNESQREPALAFSSTEI